MLKSQLSEIRSFHIAQFFSLFFVKKCQSLQVEETNVVLFDRFSNFKKETKCVALIHICKK